MAEPLFDVGLHLMHNGSSWVVTSIDNSGSAAAAGVMPGDILSHINGNSVATFSSRQISALLRGAAGSHCSLSLWRNTAGGGSAHLEARVQRKIPSHPDAPSPSELPEPAKHSRSPLYADPDDSDPDAEAKLHAQLSQISQRLDEMEQKIRAPGAALDKPLAPASSSHTSSAGHPATSSATSGTGNGIFSLKSPIRSRPSPRPPSASSSTSTSTSQSAVPHSPARSMKSSATQPLRSPAMRPATRPFSASANPSSPSKAGAGAGAAISHAADAGAPAKAVASFDSSAAEKSRTLKSNLFSSQINDLNDSASLSSPPTVAFPTRTFQSSSQVSPARDQAQPFQNRIQSAPPRDTQQPLQLQELLQKLLRQVDEAERQRLVRTAGRPPQVHSHVCPPGTRFFARQ
jgi:hypothetical protein